MVTTSHNTIHKKNNTETVIVPFLCTSLTTLAVPSSLIAARMFNKSTVAMTIYTNTFLVSNAPDNQ